MLRVKDFNTVHSIYSPDWLVSHDNTIGIKSYTTRNGHFKNQSYPFSSNHSFHRNQLRFFIIGLFFGGVEFMESICSDLGLKYLE